MPCSIQPGGLLQQMHVRYTARYKLGFLIAVERLQHEEGLSLQRAAERLFVAHLLIVKWKKQCGKVLLCRKPFAQPRSSTTRKERAVFR
jgi:hypothetical protein